MLVNLFFPIFPKQNKTNVFFSLFSLAFNQTIKHTRSLSTKTDVVIDLYSSGQPAPHNNMKQKVSSFFFFVFFFFAATSTLIAYNCSCIRIVLFFFLPSRPHIGKNFSVFVPPTVSSYTSMC